MNIFEMMRSGEVSPMWLAIVLQSIVCMTLCFLLAKSKNRSTKIALIAGAMPLINVFSVVYYVGVPKLENSTK